MWWGAHPNRRDSTDGNQLVGTTTVYGSTALICEECSSNKKIDLFVEFQFFLIYIM